MKVILAQFLETGMFDGTKCGRPRVDRNRKQKSLLSLSCVLQSVVFWLWHGGAACSLLPVQRAASVCGTSWGTTSERICPRCPCQCTWMSLSTPCRGSVRSWSTVSSWTRLMRPRTRSNVWWVRHSVSETNCWHLMKLITHSQTKTCTFTRLKLYHKKWWWHNNIDYIRGNT